MSTAKISKNDFALFGAPPAFAEPLPIGQLYFPSWERYEQAFKGIFERQYYTEYGPLNQQLENNLQQFLGVRHAICVTNATVALMMLANALELKGKVILPSFTFIASAQSLSWAGLEPVFCDVDPDTHQLDLKQVAALIDKDVSAIMGVHLWGGACQPRALEELAKAHGVQLYFDAAHAFGCAVDGVRIGNFGRAEVFSFHQDNILNATEGGCICTNDDELAAKLRVMRSSAGAGSKPAEVTKTVNGRMSEAQCAIALMSLEDFPANRQNNERLHRLYAERLAAIPGLHPVEPSGVSFSNYQYLVCRVDERAFGLSRDMLLELLKAENVNARRYFYPGVHRSIPYVQQLPQYQGRLPNTDALSASCIQLPIGALVSAQSVEVVCNILRRAHRSALEIRARFVK
ncbi:MAG: aminotransferase class I/II-fold pyridoxal phosphate-dependent enzyme [Nitrosomonadales bacterium]|nr:aminotransferase class I/II-fold pyridoxal phosphate-dependent enzyme [Nitrosomonadales bacterium]